MFLANIEQAFMNASLNNSMLVLDDFDHLLAAAAQFTPSVPLFVKWLAQQISDFKYPLVATVADPRAMNDYPDLKAAFDGDIALTPWHSHSLQCYVDEFASSYNLETAIVKASVATTPKNLIRALRQCRLQNDMAPISELLQTKIASEIGFLAKVS
jgi:hypothetical protein